MIRIFAGHDAGRTSVRVSRAVDSLGHVIGADATAEPIEPGALVLQPGAAAEALLSVAQRTDFADAECQPLEAVAWRIGLPGQPISSWMPAEYQACSGQVHQMAVRPFAVLG